MYSVMLVDDEKTIREKLPLVVPFAACGFEVTATARNGQEAWDALTLSPPDLILLDIRMPVMDGLQFMERLRKSEHKNMPVILLSGYSEFSYAQKAIRLGVKGYLTKPVDEDEAARLLMDMRDMLNQRKGPTSVASGESEALPGDGAQAACVGFNRELIDYVQSRYAAPLSLQDVAEVFHMNAAYLGRVFQKATGKSFRQYVNHLRIAQAKRLLRSTDLMIYEIAEKTGFSDSAYFVSKFTSEEGLTPVEYRKG